MSCFYDGFEKRGGIVVPLAKDMATGTVLGAGMGAAMAPKGERFEGALRGAGWGAVGSGVTHVGSKAVRAARSKIQLRRESEARALRAQQRRAERRRRIGDAAAVTWDVVKGVPSVVGQVGKGLADIIL